MSMRITESRLRWIIREEIISLSEGMDGAEFNHRFPRDVDEILEELIKEYENRLMSQGDAVPRSSFERVPSEVLGIIMGRLDEMLRLHSRRSVSQDAAAAARKVQAMLQGLERDGIIEFLDSVDGRRRAGVTETFIIELLGREIAD